MHACNADIGLCSIHNCRRFTKKLFSRKQKCGGFTYGIKCRPCTTRKVKCSFEEEVKDPRHYPYFRIQSSRSTPTRRDRIEDEREFENLDSSAHISTLNPTDNDTIRNSLRPEPVGATRTGALSNDTLPKQVEILNSRSVSYGGRKIFTKLIVILDSLS